MPTHRRTEDVVQRADEVFVHFHQLTQLLLGGPILLGFPSPSFVDLARELEPHAEQLIHLLALVQLALGVLLVDDQALLHRLAMYCFDCQ